MKNQTEAVDQFLEALEHPLKAEIEAVRSIILSADEQITEHIKWNGPSFCYAGVDRVTFNLHPADSIQLVFHRGAKVKSSEGFVFEDHSGLMKWVRSDRAVVTLKDMQDIEANRAALTDLVKAWIETD